LQEYLGPGSCDVGNNNINGGWGLLEWAPAYKKKFPNQGYIIFSHLVPFITAHGFTGLKFIRNGFLNSLIKVCEA
jgi:hypothetical protein